jgi:hypothetical protein
MNLPVSELAVNTRKASLARPMLSFLAKGTKPKLKEDHMKKVLVVLMAGVLTASMPAFALAHGGGHDQADVQCAKDCDMLLKDCSKETDSLQQRISKLEAAIGKEDAAKHVTEMRALQQKLDEAKELLLNLEKG